MGQSICCSVREKNDRLRGLPSIGSPQFWCIEVEVRIEVPKHISFAPLWHNEGSPIKRLALAGGREVHVYRVHEEFVASDVPQLLLERTLQLPVGQVVHGVIFSEDSSSRNLVVAYGGDKSTSGSSSAPTNTESKHILRVFSCEAPCVKLDRGLAESSLPAPWTLDDDFSVTLEEHLAPITKLAVSPTYMLSADADGECKVWQKNRAFHKRAAAKLHHGGVADLVVDRLFAYTVGTEECKICVWSVPELTPVLSIPADNLSVYLADIGDIGGIPNPSLPLVATNPYKLSKLTALRRPTSRWAGSQGSSRAAKTPKGCLYVAGVLAEDSEVAKAGTGIVMEWSLGPEPICHSAQVAHDAAISSLAYGPYDNGPLVTAGSDTVFRVWDSVPRLHCSQSVEIGPLGATPSTALAESSLSFPGPPTLGTPTIATPTMAEKVDVAVAVEPQHGLYSVVGDRRLFIWRRYHPERIGSAEGF